MTQKKSIPAAAANSLSKNAIAFVGYNIVFGAMGRSNIDMAAHLGGLATGLLTGYALSYRMDGVEGSARLRRSAVVMLVTLGLFVPIGWKLSVRDAKEADAYATELYGRTLTVGKMDKIVYSGVATEADAKLLGETLSRMGLMRDRGALVVYTKTSVESVVSLIVKDDAVQKPNLEIGFRFLGAMISRTMGTPMKFRLLNSKRKLQKEFAFDGKTAPLPVLNRQNK